MQYLRSQRPVFLLLMCALIAGAVGAAQAATATKASAGTDLTSAGVGVWSGGSGANGSPTSADIANWSSTSLGTGLTLGTAASWGGISVSGSSSASIDITGAGALTLGASGIAIASSAVDMSLGTPITLGANQSLEYWCQSHADNGGDHFGFVEDFDQGRSWDADQDQCFRC